MIVLKKTILEDDYEWLDANQLIDETDIKSFKIFTLGKCVADVLNYFIENSPDAFGNAPYARLEGYMYGYIHGLGMDIKIGEKEWDIVKGKRIILRVEVPKKPVQYYEALKGNRETRRKVFGM